MSVEERRGACFLFVYRAQVKKELSYPSEVSGVQERPSFPTVRGTLLVGMVWFRMDR